LPPIRRFKVTDPMSGLFLVRRDRVDCDALRPEGYKILLELLGRCDFQRVAEVGYTFQDRRGGQSKLGAGVVVDYLRHTARLAVDHPENRRVVRFGLVGLSGVAVNLLLLFLLHGVLRLHDLVAVPLAVEASILSNFLLNDRFTFRDRRQGHRLRRLAQFNAVSLLALVVNVTVYAVLARGVGLHYLAAESVAIVLAFGANYAGNLHWTYGGADGFSLRRFSKGLAPFVPVLLVTGAAAGVYLHDLDRVGEIYFDEHYYVAVARQMDNGIWEDPCWTHDAELNQRPLNYEHPPLGKLFLYWSVRALDTDHAVFTGADPGPGQPHPGCRSPDNTQTLTEPCRLVEHGEILSTHSTSKDCYDAFTARAKTVGNPWAWRLPSALFGIATVLFAGLAAQRLFGSPLAGAFAGGLVVLDTLLFTSARIAILDIFATGFLLAAVWAATFPTRKGLFGAALFLALGFASKYTVVFAGPAVFLVALWVHHRAGALRWPRALGGLATYAALPLVAWVASYWPWWTRWISEHGLGWSVRHWLDLQALALAWGTTGYDSHPYASPPGHWFAMTRPTWYYHVWNLPGGLEGWVYAVGNPPLWWLGAAVALAAMVGVGARWVWYRSGDEVRPPMDPVLETVAVVALLPAMAYAGFFLVDRATFLFYMTLVVPLLCLPLAGAMAWAWGQGRWPRVAVVAAVVLVAAGFAWYYPVASSLPITEAHHQHIMDTLPWMRE
jgi:putative flippase GtrA/predicted membrane-bound dolichyl-phosphate-mannose-protein mannosyltransferase